MGFEGRVVIVTGAARSIGRAIAERFAGDGAALVVTDLDPTVEAVATEIERDHGAKTAFTVGDLSLQPHAQAAIDAALSAFGRIDVLVNNAGGGILSPTLDHTEETMRATLDRNLWSAIYCTRAVIPPMADAGYGRVVFLGADSLRTGLDLHAIYNAAKGGVVGMAGALAREFASNGITFNTVSPTAVRSPEFERLSPLHPEATERLLASIPMHRPAEMTEVAAAVTFLASEDAGFITGQVLSVNGGATLG
jgi:2,3-dihydroxy-2,3-dihydro-p-cumate dehydrogenase